MEHKEKPTILERLMTMLNKGDVVLSSVKRRRVAEALERTGRKSHVKKKKRRSA